jgi:hypothetical protein
MSSNNPLVWLTIVASIFIVGCQSTNGRRYVDVYQEDKRDADISAPILPPRLPDSIGERRSYFGIHANNCYDKNGKEGAYIVGFYNNSPAQAANLAVGDKVIKFGNRTVNNVGDLTIAIKYFPPDDAAVISVVRRGALLSDVLVIGRGYRPNTQNGCGWDKVDEPDKISLCSSIGLREVYRAREQKLTTKCQ